jgi:hypothetical protein
MAEDQYIPPYSVTDKIIGLVAQISERIGAVTVQSGMGGNPQAAPRQPHQDHSRFLGD